MIALAEMLKNEHPEEYKALVEKVGLTEEEIAAWDAVQAKVYLPRKEGTQLLEQFEGYFDLKEVIIEKYDKNDWPIRPEIFKNNKNQSNTDHQTGGCCHVIALNGTGV